MLDPLTHRRFLEKGQRRARLAAMGPVGSPSSGDGPVRVATASVDARGDPVLRAKLQDVLGYELVPGQTITVDGSDPTLQARIMDVVNAHYAQQSAPAPEPEAEAEDVIPLLERLTALRDAGALTPEELDVQKRRLLER